jgi:hypothetical protein
LEEDRPGKKESPGRSMRELMALRHRGGLKHLEQFRTLELLKQLDLGEDQELEFLVAFKAMRAEHERLNSERIKAVEALRSELHERSLDQPAIYALIEEVSDLNRKRHELADSFVAEMRDLLSAEQLARLVVFREHFEFELLKRVREFRHQRGDGGL